MGKWIQSNKGVSIAHFLVKSQLTFFTFDADHRKKKYFKLPTEKLKGNKKSKAKFTFGKLEKHLKEKEKTNEQKK